MNYNSPNFLNEKYLLTTFFPIGDYYLSAIVIILGPFPGIIIPPDALEYFDEIPNLSIENPLDALSVSQAALKTALVLDVAFNQIASHDVGSDMVKVALEQLPFIANIQSLASRLEAALVRGH